MVGIATETKFIQQKGLWLNGKKENCLMKWKQQRQCDRIKSHVHNTVGETDVTAGTPAHVHKAKFNVFGEKCISDPVCSLLLLAGQEPTCEMGAGHPSTRGGQAEAVSTARARRDRWVLESQPTRLKLGTGGGPGGEVRDNFPGNFAPSRRSQWSAGYTELELHLTWIAPKTVASKCDMMQNIPQGRSVA